MKLFRNNVGVVIVAAIVLAIIAVILYVIMSFQPSLINKKSFAAIPTYDKSTIDTSHLQNGLLPPTNKWFSGIALQKIPKTVFPSPLSVSLTESSFSVGLPTIVTGADTITGGMAEKVTATIDGAQSYKITRYDELSVDATYADTDGNIIGTVTLTSGSPYVQFSASRDSKLTLSSDLGIPTSTNNAVAYASNKGSYNVAGFNGATIANTTITSDTGSLVSMYVTPNSNAGSELADHAGNKIVGGKVSFDKKSNSYQTKFAIKTDNGKPTLYSLLPHQTNNDAPLFAYDTLYGKQRLYAGNSFSFTTPDVRVKDQLDIANLNTDDKKLLVSTLQADNQSTTEFKAEDSYYAGKELYRSAQLLQIAEQIGESSSADNLKSKLKSQLGLWLDDSRDRSFYFDSTMKSIVGDKPSFGSENGNDHHFHYGYFIYAASILAKYDTDFLNDNKAVINLLVADIANYKTGEQLPQRRNFDPYFGHSWASGDAPFNDGNNQESSSEAINAWIATWLWADRTGNSALRDQSDWMLSNEVSATNSYWMNIDTTQKPFSNVYKHSLVSLNWSGKREYGTFFSSEPAAKLGIQLIPMSPTQLNISAGSSDVAKHVIEAISAGYAMPFGDYILMYNSQLPASSRMTIAKQLPDSAIDGANSRTYLYASLMSHK